MNEKFAVACATCPFFVEGKPNGTCHFEPPQVFVLPGPPQPVAGPPDASGNPTISMQPTMRLQSIWRTVSPDDWCGRHPSFGLTLASPIDQRLAMQPEGSG